MKLNEGLDLSQNNVGRDEKGLMVESYDGKRQVSSPWDWDDDNYESTRLSANRLQVRFLSYGHEAVTTRGHQACLTALFRNPRL